MSSVAPGASSRPPYCHVGHAPVSGDFMKQWLWNVRTRAEPTCPTCAGVSEHDQTTHHGTASAAGRACASCGKWRDGTMFVEEARAPSCRARYFCGTMCQSKLYTHQRTGLGTAGLPSRRGTVIGLMAIGPTPPAEPRAFTDAERAAATTFFHGSPELMRTHERSRAAKRGIPLPLYPSQGELTTALEQLRVRCAREAGQHFAYVSEVKPAGASGAFRTTVEPRYNRPKPLLDATKTLFLKTARMRRLPDKVYRRFRRLIEMVGAVKQHQKSVVDAREVEAVMWLTEPVRDPDSAEGTAMDGIDLIGDDAVLVGLVRLLDQMWEAMVPEDTLLVQFRAIFVHLGFADEVNPIGLSLNWALSTAHRRSMDLNAYDTPYAIDVNYENLNEIGAGMRVSALVHAGVTPGFTPIYDFFFCNSREGVPVEPRDSGAEHDGSNELSVFVVGALNDEHVMNIAIRNPHPGADVAVLRDSEHLATFLEYMRSMISQLLLALEAAQYHLRFVHYDLHIGNTMYLGLSEQEYGQATLQFRRPPGRGVQFIPADSTASRLLRIIDYGRARVDHPLKPGDDTTVAHIDMGFVTQEYDQWVDARAFGWDIGRVHLRAYGWMSALVVLYGTTEGLGPDATQFVDVFEEMVGMRHWTDYMRDYTDLPWTAGVGVRNPFLDFLAQTQHLNFDTDPEISDFRTNEIFGNRPLRRGARPPADILDMPFFERYRDTPSSTGLTDFIGDATRSVADAATTTSGSGSSGGDPDEA